MACLSIGFRTNQFAAARNIFGVLLAVIFVVLQHADPAPAPIHAVTLDQVIAVELHGQFSGKQRLFGAGSDP
jgi:hypothetical protein